MDAASPSSPHIAASGQGDDRQAVLTGRWTASDLAGGDHLGRVRQALAALPATAGWDLQQIERLDHLGAQLLWNHWGRQWPARLALLPEQRSMLERVAEFSCARKVEADGSFAQTIDTLGASVLRGLGQLKSGVRLIGQLALDGLRFARRPQYGPWRDISGHLYQMGAMALPITALVGALIGVVLAYLTALQLRQFGAESFIVNILGVSLVRELGPMLAAILVAGRSGSAITAQIGVMRVTEELDAMRVMGIAHGFRLVLPRAIALAIAMPLIATWTTLAGMAGGMLAADLALGITPAYFVGALPDAVSAANLSLAVSKSVVFGILIALIGCHYGLRVKPNTESLGQGTTASVVSAITAVILVDALFAVVFRSVGI
ncbi:ABC transporter permease [Pseudorhodoferax sp. Leaf265]|jgi:phospholipid/cholesterol/gamma-HCH transport system permease protein|uniref:MlaE family ABC transporter permease n=1 Tax=Pseudorhodoferax sp. Leaf265 TaxID=1736315 RepID=UPI0009EBF2A5|nr:ABC transporter permease [Pseudorhodoferax sp. Leaf265]PZQ02937.1 MAG: ABC transporter permease [Variovorax paradoxus]PZQ16849.1 MAG: ABC transporter permease [Variovorax paradoxus]